MPEVLIGSRAGFSSGFRSLTPLCRFDTYVASMTLDLTYIGAFVLHTLQCGQRYGFQVMAATKLPSGTVYPALRRLEKAGFIRSQWEKATLARAEQRPARKYYQVTPAGDAALAAAAKRYRLPEIEGVPNQAEQ